jgi:hypothetical protein
MKNRTWNDVANRILETFRSIYPEAEKSWPDLRANMARIALPDERQHLPDEPLPPEAGPSIVSPSIGGQVFGDVAKG